MARGWWLLITAGLLSGCRDAPRPVPPPPPVTGPIVDEPEPVGFEDVLTALLAAEPATSDRPERLAALSARLPGTAERQRVAAARVKLGDGAAPPDAAAVAAAQREIDAAREGVDQLDVYGLDAADADRRLQLAARHLEGGRPIAAAVDLERAQALLTVTPVEAALRRLATANDPAAAALLRRAHYRLVARGRVGTARQRVESLVLGEAATELDQAAAALREWAAAEPSQLTVVDGLLADLAGAQADLRAGAPGAAERLTALWRKLDPETEDLVGGGKDAAARGGTEATATETETAGSGETREPDAAESQGEQPQPPQPAAPAGR